MKFLNRLPCRVALSRAAAFMMNRLAYRGGFVWKYSLDLHQRDGELKARDSMIWVEPPGTPTVGLMLLKAHAATGDSIYLAYADRVATALIEGQLPCGGWHYFIDFAPAGTQSYYDEFLSRQWGWQEFKHYYRNATFDDDVTASATRFLLRWQRTSHAPNSGTAVQRALDFILRRKMKVAAGRNDFRPPKQSLYMGIRTTPHFQPLTTG